MWNIAQMLPSLCTAAPHLKKIGKERLWFTVDNRVQRPRDFFRWGAAVNRLMLPKVRKSASGRSKCKIVLQTQKSAQKVLSAIGKGLTTTWKCLISRFVKDVNKQANFLSLYELGYMVDRNLSPEEFACVWQSKWWWWWWWTLFMCRCI